MSTALVEPLLRMPCTQRCSVERGMPYSTLEGLRVKTWVLNPVWGVLPSCVSGCD